MDDFTRAVLHSPNVLIIQCDWCNGVGYKLQVKQGNIVQDKCPYCNGRGIDIRIKRM